jgi:hypothetical protein
MSHQYSITVTNHARQPNYFMVYQTDPGSFAPNALALAWFSKYSNPGDNSVTNFAWEIDWGFTWADTGTLSPGITYAASDLVPAEGVIKNQVTLDYNNAYLFKNLTRGENPDRFYIQETGNIPINSTASVGIAMSGKTVYAVQASPNQTLTFSPHPTYWLAYGNYASGTVLDLSAINHPLELKFETGVYSLAVTLNPDNSWSELTSVAERNARFLAARKTNPQIQWAAV